MELKLDRNLRIVTYFIYFTGAVQTARNFGFRTCVVTVVQTHHHGFLYHPHSHRRSKRRED